MNLTTIFVILGILAAIAGIAIPFFLVVKKAGAPKSWHLDEWSKHVTDFKDGSFTFPNQDGVHFPIKPISGVKSLAVSIDFEITGSNPVFESAGGGEPQLHLFFNTDMGNGRYWSRYEDRRVLKLGRQLLTVQLTPELWNDVNGKPATDNVAAFNDVKSHAVNIGYTFGDQFGYSHGAWVKSGSAKFKLISFSP